MSTRVHPRGATAWSLGLAVEALCTNELRKRFSGYVGPPYLGSEALFSLCMGDHWPRAVTIESLLEVGVVWLTNLYSMAAMTLV